MVMMDVQDNNEETQHAVLIRHNQHHFDKESTNWDDPEVVKVSQESYTTLQKHLSKFISSETRVLNFGCGTGLLESQLRHDVKECVGIDISHGMVERMQSKIDKEQWENVRVIKMDILPEEDSDASSQQLQYEGLFDMIVSLYTFHHLKDISAIGKALMKHLRPGGIFCIVDFASVDQDKSEEFHSHLSEEAKASIGTHDGFAKDFLIDFYQCQLGLRNVEVHSACPLKCGSADDEEEYPTVIAYGQKC